jgi:hypothetical protein
MQCFRQGSQSVEDCYQELQKDMIHCGLLGKNDATMACFRGGLNREIQDILDCTEYADMTTLFEYDYKAEHGVQGRRSKQYYISFAGQSSTSSSTHALPAPSTLTTTMIESKAPSTPTTTPLERMAKPASTCSCTNLEPSRHNAPNTPTDNIGNAHGATLTAGENCVNVLNFSTHHALVEQLIVEPLLNLSLSYGDLLEVSFNKDELRATTSVLHASAENKHIMHVANENDELHLSSLHTVGYIEFDDLCNIDCLEERIFAHADLPWLSKHSYHIIGKYNNTGQYMVHRVYICSNLNSPVVVQDCARLEGNLHTNIFTCSSSSYFSQEGKHCRLLSMIFGAEFSCNEPTIPIISFVGTNLLQDSNDKHLVSFDNDVSRGAANIM